MGLGFKVYGFLFSVIGFSSGFSVCARVRDFPWLEYGHNEYHHHARLHFTT